MLYIHENTIYNSTYIKDLAYLCWHQSLEDYILSKASDLSSASCSTAILIIQPTVPCVLSKTCKCDQLCSTLHRSCLSSTREEKVQWRALTFPGWGFHFYVCYWNTNQHIKLTIAILCICLRHVHNQIGVNINHINHTHNNVRYIFSAFFALELSVIKSYPAELM